MAQNNAKFVAEINAFIAKTNKNITEVKKLAVYQLFETIVDRTPIWFRGNSHAGTAKWNWTISFGNIKGTVLKGTDTVGTTTKGRGWAQLQKLTELNDEDIYIENSVPYIFILEDGGYPSPVQVGSYNKATRSYEIRSAGGRSLQSPTGMVHVAALVWNVYAEEAIRKVGR